MFEMNQIKQGAVAAVAAIILTATAVGAAVGPAEKVGTAPLFAKAEAAATLNG